MERLEILDECLTRDMPAVVVWQEVERGPAGVPVALGRRKPGGLGECQTGLAAYPRLEAPGLDWVIWVALLVATSPISDTWAMVSRVADHPVDGHG